MIWSRATEINRERESCYIVVSNMDGWIGGESGPLWTRQLITYLSKWLLLFHFFYFLFLFTSDQASSCNKKPAHPYFPPNSLSTVCFMREKETMRERERETENFFVENWTDQIEISTYDKIPIFLAKVKKNSDSVPKNRKIRMQK